MVALERIADALSDANRCVELRSDWPKVYHALTIRASMRTHIMNQTSSLAHLRSTSHPHSTPTHRAFTQAHYRRGIVLQLLGSTIAEQEEEGSSTHHSSPLSSSSSSSYLADAHAAFAAGLRCERPENAVARAATVCGH